MNAIILGNSPTFHAVNYNIDKMDKGKGELMAVANFGPLQELIGLRPEDYKSYLQLLAARNKRIKGPQFHAVISAKGHSHDKHELTAIAKKWLNEMGYGHQPHLIVYHNDTANAHVHMVSVRIGRNGKKINSGYEHIRAVRSINKIMGLDEKHSFQADVDKAFAYSFSTKAQFKMLLESMGYKLSESEGKLELTKFGTRQGEISLELAEEKINGYQPNDTRRLQLKAFFHKYGAQYDTTLKPETTPLPGGFNKLTGGYTSEFAAYLHIKMGVHLMFHASQGKSSYGYTIIDHAGKTVWKGGEIIPLKELQAMTGQERFVHEKELPVVSLDQVAPETTDYYSALLKAALYNYPDLEQGLQAQGLQVSSDEEPLLIDPPAGVAMPISKLLSGTHLVHFEQHRGWHQANIPGIYIASDIDDEAINGRNRRRKRKARTNTR